MRILLTRPLEDSLRTAQELAELGHTAVVAPLFETRSLDGPELTLDGVQAILATSSNGVRALARRCARRDVPVFAVGTRTAAAAYESGFAAIGDAGGDAKALEAMVSAQLQPEAGALLHAAGANSTGELAAALAHKGFEVHRCVLYEAVEVRELPSAAGEALGAGLLHAVLVFSPRSGRLLAEGVRRAGLASTCKTLLACCISNETAVAIAGLAFGEIRIAAHPDRDSLLALLGEVGEARFPLTLS